MRSTVADRIEYLRLKAAEMRAAAEKLGSLEARNAMLSVAQGYDTLADAAAMEITSELNTSPRVEGTPQGRVT